MSSRSGLLFALALILVPGTLTGLSAHEAAGGPAAADLTHPGVPPPDTLSGVPHPTLASFLDLGAVLDPIPVPADSQWWDGFKRPGVSRVVRALMLYEGDLIAAGSILEADSIRVLQLARWDGSEWSAFTGGLTDIQTLTVYDEKIIAGRTGSCGGHLVKWWDGSEWQPLGHGLETGDFDKCWEFPEWVDGLAEYGGYLYAGGWFYKYMNNPKANLLRWDGANWSSLGSTVNYPVSAFAHFDGKLIVGGSFTEAAGVSAYRIAAWDGSAWSSLGDGINSDIGGPSLDKDVRALAVHDENLYAGGKFNRADSSEADNLARWDGEGWTSTGFVAGGEVDGSGGPFVNTLTVYDGLLIVGGNFRKSDGALGNFIASYDGETWDELGQGLNGEVIALQVREGLLIAGGSFYASDADIIYNGAIWDGEAWHPMGEGEGMRGNVNSLVVHDDHLVAGGDFNVAGGVFANRVALWDGTTWDSLGGGWDRTDANVSLLAVFQGNLLGVGDLESGVIKRWDGSEWQAYAADFGSQVRAITVYEDNLIASGDEVAAWDGVSWTTLGGPTDGYVNTMVVLDGTLIAGGKFSDINGVAAMHVAMWNGSDWSAMGDGFNFGFPKYGVVNELFVFEGELHAGGYFDRTGNKPLKNIAKWKDGIWVSVGEGITRDVHPHVYEMTIYNGTLIAAGDFRWAGSLPAWNIARWNGSAWSPMGSGIGVFERTCGSHPCSYTVDALAVFNGSLYAGGYFKYAGGKTSFFMARWKDAFPGMVMHFDALPSGSGVNLQWINPDTTEYTGTLIRYSTTEYSQNPTDGLPVPNGTDGHFDGEPGSEGSFVHEGVEGVTYYYAAFAYDNSLTHSTPAFASATAWDSVPPEPLAYFEAAEDTCRVCLAWTTPPDDDLSGVIIRYSAEDYPSDPADGLPVPNGSDGRFESLPDSAVFFIHENLACDTTYFYSAWAYDPGFNYSETSHAMARSLDPPAALPLKGLSVLNAKQGVVIEWTNPDPEEFTSALIRFSVQGHPVHRLDGHPVPNGNDGVFEGDPGADTVFVHSGLGNGLTYYYSAWAQYQGDVHAVPGTGSATRASIPPPAEFEAAPLIDGIRLSWTNPEDERFSHTLVRYSTDDYPVTGEDGLPLPNGNDGIFEGAPGSDTSFFHTEISPVGYYYYSAWALDIDSNYSTAVNAIGVSPTDTLTVFHVIPNDETCYLTWTVPPHLGIDSVVVRFSTEEFPQTVEEGQGVPNGEDGWFEVRDIGWYYFWHNNLDNGVMYYYSGFVHFIDMPWYSAPVMRSAMPVSHGPTSPTLALFNATCDDGSVYLSWTPPDEVTVDSVVVRFSTVGFPDGPEDGEPVPNGNDGWFAAAQGVSGEFIHSGLVNGQAYYYSGFVHFRDPVRFSEAATSSCTPEEPPDEEPPDLSVSVMQNPYLTKYLDVYLVSSEALLPESVSVHVGGTEVAMELIDPSQHVWKGDYTLDGPAASVSVVACACDSALNRICETVSFAAGYLTRLAGGEVSSPDGAVRLEISPGVVGRDTYVLIVPQEGHLSTYRLSPEHILGGRRARLAFSYRDFQLEPQASPGWLYIEQGGEEPLACYVDPDRQSIVTTVSTLGTFRLMLGNAGSSSILDPEFLRVESPRPNPFNSKTRVRLEVRARQNVRAVVYDAQGRMISELLDSVVDPGLLDLSWDGTSRTSEAPSGIYFLEIRTERRSASRKLLLLK